MSVALPFALVVLSVVFCYVVRESWWARYAPYLYFVPLFAFMAVCRFPLFGVDGGRGDGREVPAMLFAFALALNAWQMTAYPVRVFRESRDIGNALERMSNLENVRIDLCDYKGIAFNFLEYGCHFTVEELSDETVLFYYDRMRVEKVAIESGT